MKVLIWLFAFWSPIWLFGQNIDSNRTTVWPSSYLNSVHVPNDRIVNIEHLTDNLQSIMLIDSLLHTAVNKLGHVGGVILLSPGYFSISQTFELPSHVYLIGSGSSKTKLFIDLSGTGHGILAKGKLAKNSVQIHDSVTIGAKELKVLNHSYQVGDLIQIEVADDSLITSSWAKGSVGQITQVSKLNDSTIFLADPLRLDIVPSRFPKLTTILPVVNCGILNLTLERLDSTLDQTDNIRFEYTQNALVYGVESIKCNFSHVNQVGAYKSYVYGSYFHHAFSYGGGGKGYGTVLSFTSSNCMLENNIFDSLRHAVLFQAGPNGNVVGYNYSMNPFWTEVSFPSDLSGDIVFHGNYPFFNLIEGNICQNLVIDDSHGINGPNNTFMRNRIEHAGIFMNFSPASDSQIFIGNEITGTGAVKINNLNFALGLYFLQGTGHLEYGNNKNGKIIPEGSSADTKSFYHQFTPSFWLADDWPSIGPPNEINGGNIPAYHRSSRKIKTLAFPFGKSIPFEFISFRVTPSNPNAELKWKIKGIESCQRFEIYRQSFPGAVKLVKAENCDTVKNSTEFNYVDEFFSEIFEQSDSLKYYIVMENIFGESVNSDTITLFNQRNLSVFLNPRGQFHSNEIDISEIKIYDLQGVFICSLSSKESLPFSIPTGIYYAAIFKKNRLAGYQKIYWHPNHF